MHKRIVFNLISRMILLVSLFLLLPLAWAVADHPDSAETHAFIVTILAGLAFACVGNGVFRLEKIALAQMGTKDGLAIVGLTWITLSAFGALPFFLSGEIASYTDAFFETASGLTTTGASILTDVEALSRGLLFWRSLTHWIGGMGIVVLFVALLPSIGGGSLQLYRAEASGVTVDRVAPRIRENAKILWLIYFFLSLACFGLLFVNGMPVFDALCHAFGAIATGGFSTKNAGVAVYGPAIQWTLTLFMFLGGVNFILYYQLFRGKPRELIKDEELRMFALIVVGVSLVFAFLLWPSGVASPVRHAFFQATSILTTTGFVTTDFDRWPDVLRGLVLFLMFIGGSAGSTSGGFKIVRTIMLVKSMVKSVVKAIYPNAVVPARFNQKPFSEKIELAVLTYFSIFVVLIAGGTLFLLVSDRTDIITAFSAALSATSSVGPGLGGVGPMQNFGWLSDPGKYALVFLMIAGRLEMYAFLILFFPTTWKK